MPQTAALGDFLSASVLAELGRARGVDHDPEGPSLKIAPPWSLPRQAGWEESNRRRTLSQATRCAAQSQRGHGTSRQRRSRCHVHPHR